MDQLPIRYAKSGDFNIACAAVGTGPPDIVFIQGSISNLGVNWEDARYRGWCERMASFSRLILFDKRGMGLSDRVQAGNPRTIEAHVRASFGTDTRAILPTIHVSTLVLHRTNDEAVAVGQGRYVAEHIPGARLVELPGVDHLPWINGDDLLDEIQEFVTGSRPTPDADRMLATVLFTDIVGSTERAAEVGDRRWAELLVAHQASMRRELDRFKGEEVDTAGDGFLATFDGPTRAVRCALSAVGSARAQGLHIRAGLHTGEVVRVGGKPGGVAQHIGARVAALAGADEVLVSSTVRDLAAGSGIEFTDRGNQVLKGVPGEWRIYGAGT